MDNQALLNYFNQTPVGTTLEQSYLTATHVALVDGWNKNFLLPIEVRAQPQTNSDLHLLYSAVEKHVPHQSQWPIQRVRLLGDIARLYTLGVFEEDMSQPLRFAQILDKSIENSEARPGSLLHMIGGEDSSSFVLQQNLICGFDSIARHHGEHTTATCLDVGIHKFMMRAVGWGDEIGVPQIAKDLLLLIDRYGNDNIDYYQSSIVDRWFSNVGDIDDQYGTSDNDASLETLEIMMEHGIDPTVMLSKLHSRFTSPSFRTQEVIGWLLDKGADWRIIDLDRASAKTREHVNRCASAQRDQLQEISNQHRPDINPKSGPKVKF